MIQKEKACDQIVSFSTRISQHRMNRLGKFKTKLDDKRDVFLFVKITPLPFGNRSTDFQIH